MLATLRSRPPLLAIVVAAVLNAAAGAAEHPVVAGFERFYNGPAPAVDFDLADGGLILLGELNCTSCHTADRSIESSVVRKQAPILDKVGARVRPGYLRAFLSDPQAVKPGTTMPHVLAALPADEKTATVEALVHFLASTGSVVEQAATTRAAAAGKKLYHQVGCVACHGRRDEPGGRLAADMPLGDLAGKYTVASLAEFLQDPLRVRPSGRMPALNLIRNEPIELASYLLQDRKTRPKPNLSYEYYEGTWKSLPDFATLTPKARGQAAGFDVGLAQRAGDFALRFEGFFQNKAGGEYTFHLTSDDGSKLYLDDRLVVDNDGIHGVDTQSGRIELTKGMHRLVVAYFNSWGESELEVEYEGRGLARQSILAAVYLDPGEPGAEEVARAGGDGFAVDATVAEQGRALFARVGCASCHAMRVADAPLAPTVAAPRLDQLDRAPKGCLAPAPASGVPAYALSDRQREALVAALGVLAKGPPSTPTPRAAVARTMTTFNCYACHVRDGRGGVEAARQEFFATTQKEMGDEGRIPPSLDGAGAKLEPAYIKKYLDVGVKDRPYMLTRMPRFGAANLPGLTAALAALDPIEPVPVPQFAESTRLVKSLGRFLAGGEALGCIKCHTFKGIESEGVQAVDLTVLTHRLRRDWFHRYLVDTQAFRPGTRMPTAWPGGKTMLPQVAGGDTTRQIEAIWRFLDAGKDAVEPYGLGREPIPLVPQPEPIVYRNFLKGAGPRAIGVGYPEHANVAFDANDLRLALVWQGAFIDAARHWSARGAGFQPPLGDNVLTLPAGPGFAVLSNADELWPRDSARELGSAFRGYRLSKDGRPTFLYDVAGLHVADFPDAVAAAPGAKAATLRRTLTLTGPAPPRDVYFRAIAASRIEPQGGGWYTIDGEWKMRIEAEAPPILRRSEGKTELLVPIRRGDAPETTIVQEFVW
jgi:mono/diheme cytochrome c family protein